MDLHRFICILLSLCICLAQIPDTPELKINYDLMDGVPARISCLSENNNPNSKIQWFIGSKNVTNMSTLRIFPDGNNQTAYLRSTLAFLPLKEDHGKNLTCEVLQMTANTTRPFYSQKVRRILDILYPPVIDELSVRQFGTNVTFTCRADANPPTIEFTWFHNRSRLNITETVRLSTSFHYESTGTSVSCVLTIQDFSSNDRGEYECEALTEHGSSSSAINYTFASIPEPPSNFEVYRKQTTSSSLVVAWQPEFDGGFQQTFTLQYCIQGSKGQLESKCNYASEITGRNHILKGLRPYTLYELTLWAENVAGNSSRIIAVASTAPLSPRSYGVFVTLDTQKGVLTFAERNNTNPHLDAICFIIRRNGTNERQCDSVNETECIEPGAKVESADPDDDLVAVTFGRGLCSEPEHVTTVTVTSSSGTTLFLATISGVVGGSGFMILFTLGLMSLIKCYHLRADKDKSRSESETQQSTEQMVPSQMLQISDDAFSTFSPQHSDHQIRPASVRYIRPGGSKPPRTHDSNAMVGMGEEGEEETEEEEKEEEGEEEEGEEGEKGEKVRKDGEIASTSAKRLDSHQMSDELTYIDLSHDNIHPLLRPTPVRHRGDTVYASLTFHSMEARKKENIPTKLKKLDFKTPPTDDNTLYINFSNNPIKNENILTPTTSDNARSKLGIINQQDNNYKPPETFSSTPIRDVGQGSSTAHEDSDLTVLKWRDKKEDGNQITSQEVVSSRRMETDVIINADLPQNLIHPRPTPGGSQEGTMYAPGDFDGMGVQTKEEKEGVGAPSQVGPSTKSVKGNELIYADLSHDITHPPKPAPVRCEEHTILYSPLDFEAMAAPKNESIPKTAIDLYSERTSTLEDDEKLNINLSNNPTLPSRSRLARTKENAVKSSMDVYATVTRK